MWLDLRKALCRSTPPDVESETAFFYQHAPHIGSHAYIHIIFKPRPELLPVVDHLGIPAVWRDFLTIQNGADVFSNSLALFGLTDPTQLINRRNYLELSPWSIAENNRTANGADSLQIGVYCFDRSRVLLSRSDGTVCVTSERESHVLARWPNVETFLNDEIARLKSLFSPDGKPLTESRLTLPNTMRIQ